MCASVKWANDQNQKQPELSSPNIKASADQHMNHAAKFMWKQDTFPSQSFLQWQPPDPKR